MSLFDIDLTIEDNTPKYGRCIADGCNTYACYNLEGETRAKFCKSHAEPGMIDIKHKTCQHPDCETRTRYGKPGRSPTHCAQHRETGMIQRPNSFCIQQSCREKAIYGPNMIPVHCESHKEPDDLNLVENNCKSCGFLYVLDDNGHCESCDPTKFQRARLAKQNALMTFLDRNGYPGEQTDKVIDNGTCGKERPDRIIDLTDKIIVIECDEHQHKDRACECEQTRMINIGQSYGGIPIYFIRWNPDNYKTPAGRQQENITGRYDGLLTHLNFIKEGKMQLPHALVSVFYMYFDGWKGDEDLTANNWEILLRFD